MREQRTDVDFSKHELIVTESEEILIHHLKEPGTIIYNVKFINTNDIMAVTGDCGNWIFCREFHPSAGGMVSSGYWLEKIQINSTQDGQVFSEEYTREEIEEGINGGLADYGYKGDELQQVVDYYKDLLNYVDLQEWEYVSFAYNNFPPFMDAESVPFVKDTKANLKVVFDAFDEICRRMKDENQKIILPKVNPDKVRLTNEGVYPKK